MRIFKIDYFPTVPIDRSGTTSTFLTEVNVRIESLTKFFMKNMVLGFVVSLTVFSVVNVSLNLLRDGEIIVNELFQSSRFAYAMLYFSSSFELIS